MIRKPRKHLTKVDKENTAAIFTPQEEKELEELLNAKIAKTYHLARVSNGLFGETTLRWVPSEDPLPLWLQVIVVLGNLLGLLLCLGVAVLVGCLI